MNLFPQSSMIIPRFAACVQVSRAPFFFSAKSERALRGKAVPKGVPRRESRPGGENPMRLLSKEFAHNKLIPRRYACYGEGVSPPLEIAGVPVEAVSLALIMHDPDAPVEGGWTHWTLFNMSPGVARIDENSVPESAVEGMTDSGRPGYGGPCPPSGTHHYHFRLYALDTFLALGSSATKKDVEHGMEGHVLGEAILTGLYGH